MPDRIENPEDAKLLTLAKAARARLGAKFGAAVRDGDGRTYAAANVVLPSFELTAPALAAAMAVSSGAKGLEAAAVVAVDGLNAVIDLTPFRDLGGEDLPVFVGDDSGALLVVRYT